MIQKIKPTTKLVAKELEMRIIDWKLPWFYYKLNMAVVYQHSGTYISCNVM